MSIVGFETNSEPYRVLTLDGGGMRGLYSANFLNTLAMRFDKKFSDGVVPDIGKAFNMICGTSTGAILACGLAAGIPIKDIIDLYNSTGTEIFPNPLPKHTIKQPLWYIKHTYKSSAKGQRLKNKLYEVFGDKTIGETYSERGIALCIPCVDATNNKAVVFKSEHNKGKHRDNKCKLVDVCMASSAAPLYFPMYEMANPENATEVKRYIDGGLWANNPILLGLVEALGLVNEAGTSILTLGKPIQVLSVGTNDQPSGDAPPIEGQNDWGIWHWIKDTRILNSMFSSQATGYTFMANFLSTTLKRIHLDVEVVRFQESPKALTQYNKIGLDKADKEAINTLLNLSTTEAENYHSKVINDSGKTEHSIIQEIFTNLIVINK